MDSNKWFESGCNYQEGVTLYASLKGHSPNLLRLFLRKESRSTTEKLRYELGKFRAKKKIKSQTSIASPSAIKTEISTPVYSMQQPLTNNSTKGFYRLNELHVDLHPIAQKQRSDYQKAIGKHLQLIHLLPEEEGAALKLCIEIEDLFDAIATSQKVLDHYVQHKIILNSETRNFKDLTPSQLLRSRNNKSTSVSKYKKRVSALKTSLKQPTSKSEKTRLAVTLQRAEQKLIHHEMELQELNNLINQNE